MNLYRMFKFEDPSARNMFIRSNIEVLLTYHQKESMSRNTKFMTDDSRARYICFRSNMYFCIAYG